MNSLGREVRAVLKCFPMNKTGILEFFAKKHSLPQKNNDNYNYSDLSLRKILYKIIRIMFDEDIQLKIFLEFRRLYSRMCHSYNMLPFKEFGEVIPVNPKEIVKKFDSIVFHFYDNWDHLQNFEINIYLRDILYFFKSFPLAEFEVDGSCTPRDLICTNQDEAINGFAGFYRFNYFMGYREWELASYKWQLSRFPQRFGNGQ